jgi:biotin carboxyl carrier protein
MKYLVKITDKEFEVEIREKDSQLWVKLNGQEYPARLLEAAVPRYSFMLGNTVLELESEKSGFGQEVIWKGRKFIAHVEDKRLAEIEKTSPSTKPVAKELKSPLPGVVVKVEVKEEEEVEAGQGVVILEAMKMENEIKSPFAGRVKKVLVREKQTVEKNQPLVIFA